MPTAIGSVALDTRLGCLRSQISSESETSRIIQSIHTFFVNVAEVELRTPFWRVWSTPTWNKYIGALDVFRE
jgi:cytochrome P450 family 49 subfamily A